MRALIGAIIISLGISSLAVAQQPKASDVQVTAMVEALRKAAPPQSPNDGLYSDWQIKPGIIPSWSKQCLQREITAQQLEANPATARAVVSCIVRRELNSQLVSTNNNEQSAVRGTACWWMTGDYKGCRSGFTADYVKRVVELYNKERARPATR
ncbi:MAG: hypothetical protein IGS39_19025 [Calothrix sp. C42_A2020_038]|nr:hypothetical protein [Calothrix sp. C42_A2020_038]